METFLFRCILISFYLGWVLLNFTNQIIEIRIKFPEDSEENFEEDFSSNDDEDDSGAENFGSLINASTEETKKTAMDHLMTSVENIQKSVNQLAAAVTVTKNIEDNVTPSPNESIPTTSRRSVDIDSLIANKKDDKEVKTERNDKKRKSKGLRSRIVLSMFSIIV